LSLLCKYSSLLNPNYDFPAVKISVGRSSLPVKYMGGGRVEMSAQDAFRIEKEYVFVCEY